MRNVLLEDAAEPGVRAPPPEIRFEPVDGPATDPKIEWGAPEAPGVEG